MTLLNKEDILNIKDTELKEFSVPEWGGSVFIAPMTLDEKMAFDEKHLNYNTGAYNNFSTTEFQLEVLKTCLKNKDGYPLFTDEDLPFLRKKNALVLLNLYTECMKTCFINVSAVDLIKKKSPTTH
jgi:hypothetical protein